MKDQAIQIMETLTKKIMTTCNICRNNNLKGFSKCKEKRSN